MSLIAILVGGFAGGTLSQTIFGVLVGAVLAWLVARSLVQHDQIKQLQHAAKMWRDEALAARTRRVGNVDMVSRPASGAVDPPASEPTLGAEPATHAAVSTGLAPLVQISETKAAHAPLGQPLLPTKPSAVRTAPPRGPDSADQVRAWMLGGNPIAKAGIGILFVGLAFLAKYASDHALLPLEYRLAGIAAAALVLLGLGWRLRAVRPDFAQALQGGAVAVLYLTLFVAFRFYGLLATGPVFTLMVLVAALAAALAVLQDARALAVIGALGGFATLLLVSSGGGSDVALLSYYLVLDLGVAAVGWFRNWRPLNAVGFVFTFGLATVWGLFKYEPAKFSVAQGFLIAYFLLFNAVLLMPARRLKMAGPLPKSTSSGSDTWVNGGLLFGVPTMTFVLQHGLMRDTAYGTALSALALAAFYVLLATQMRKNAVLAVLFDAALAIATVFISLVIPFALDVRSTGGAWALEGAGLLWLGFRQQRRVPRIFGYALLAISGGVLLLAQQWYRAPTAVFNAWFLNALLLAVGALAGAFFVCRGTAGGKGMPEEKSAERVLIGWGLLWALGAAALEIHLFATERQSVTAWLLALTLVALPCMLAAMRLRWHKLGLTLTVLAPALLVLAAGSVLLLDNPAQQGGWWAWPLGLAFQLLVLRCLAPAWPAGARYAVHAMGPLVLAVLGAHAGGDMTRGWGDATTAWPWLGTLLVPALLLLALPRVPVARRWPVSAEPSAYQAAAGAVLAVALLLWTVLANWWSTGAAAPLPHVPLLNPLDLGVSTAVFAVWAWLQHPSARARLVRAGLAPLAVFAGVTFFWINAVLLRAFHQWGGVPYRLDAWMQSLPVQSGVTLLWSATALALMWLSARRAQRTPWMVGVAVLAVVVAKLLLVDLSGSGTVTRIVSFIGVGLLMLVMGYVAPLPSSKPARETR